MESTGLSSSVIVAARDWLEKHGAIERVPYDKRVGAELDLPHRQIVYQITGTVALSNGAVEYLYVSPANGNVEVSESETSKFRKSKLSESESKLDSIKDSTGINNTPPTSGDGSKPSAWDDPDDLFYAVARLSFGKQPGDKIGRAIAARINDIMVELRKDGPIGGKLFTAFYLWAEYPGAASSPKTLAIGLEQYRDEIAKREAATAARTVNQKPVEITNPSAFVDRELAEFQAYAERTLGKAKEQV